MVLSYKMRQILLQNATDISLQNKKKVHYKMRQLFYYKMQYKMRQLFYYKMQVITNWDNFVTKCESYYKMRQLLQTATVHIF